MCVCMYVCMYVCTYVCVCVHVGVCVRMCGVYNHYNDHIIFVAVMMTAHIRFLMEVSLTVEA